MFSEADIRRLGWHCRRGMLELDVVLIPFLDNRFRSLEEADQVRFEKLLAEEDQDIFSWIMRNSEPQDADIKRIVTLILDGIPA